MRINALRTKDKRRARVHALRHGPVPELPKQHVRDRRQVWHVHVPRRDEEILRQLLPVLAPPVLRHPAHDRDPALVREDAHFHIHVFVPDAQDRLLCYRLPTLLYRVQTTPPAQFKPLTGPGKARQTCCQWQ